MRKPYGILVEFISRYNCGGGFWWDRWEGFWNVQMESMFDRQNNGMKLWWRSTKAGDLLGNFQESETKVKSRTIWFKKIYFENRKSFSGARKYY